ncbi:unnamed protein product, partial [Hapterophycus canaliculatus]
RFAADGRPYYVDNNRRITQWHHPAPMTGHPSAQPYNSAGSSSTGGGGGAGLPSGWERR